MILGCNYLDLNLSILYIFILFNWWFNFFKRKTSYFVSYDPIIEGACKII